MSAANLLDAQFASTMKRISAALHGAPRHIRVRGELWYQRLSFLTSIPQDELRRDRNLQADLLLKCIEEGRWIEPMDKHPPEGPLPTLPPHLACMLRRRRQERSFAERGGAPIPSGPPISRCFPSSSSSAISPEYPSCAGSEASSCDLRSTCPPPLLQRFTCPRPATRTTVPLGHAGRVDGERSLAGSAAGAMGIPSYAWEEGIPEDALSQGVVAPPAFASLAARVAHLQDENRRLRRQLSHNHEAPATPVVSAGRNAFSAASRTQTSQRSSHAAGVVDALLEEPQVFDAAAADVRPHVEAMENMCLQDYTHQVMRVAAEHGEHVSPRLHASSDSQPPRGEREESSDVVRLAAVPSLAERIAQHDEIYEGGEWRPKSCLSDIANVIDHRGDMQESGLKRDVPGPPPPEEDTEGFLRYLDRFQAYTGKLCAEAST